MSISHVNVVRFCGTMNLEDDVCIVTEWVSGGSVMSYLEADPDASRLDIMSQVAAGLKYLHTPIPSTKNIIIHGDLHSGNVLITKDKFVKLCDFGLSKIIPHAGLASISERFEMPRGRAAYVAPELHQPTIPRSESTDAFAYAVLGWELYAGSPPFSNCESGTMAIIARMGIGERPQRSAITRDDLSDNLWDVISQCWDHDAANRPTMRAVRKRLLRASKALTSCDGLQESWYLA